ncbi:MAG: zf-HC2 domain-containing protein [Candidatus Hydrogenedentes bacterium]|nr:zf-HC2 domain-containing protein [Candidatus Hydrogenedentota bacterium]
MSPNCDEIQAKLSGYLDGELDADESARIAAHLKDCPECAREHESMREVIGAASALRVAEPPEEVWDTFLDNVYNRLERRTGWAIFTLGMVLVSGLAMYEFVVLEWASTPVKIICSIPLLGLVILFINVIRQRRLVAKTDRYSRDVRR